MCSAFILLSDSLLGKLPYSADAQKCQGALKQKKLKLKHLQKFMDTPIEEFRDEDCRPVKHRTVLVANHEYK
jgi:hypothetical protein